MSTTGNHIYTAEDIHNYLAGKLTPDAMHAMEKAALDDPLLSEALDGYEEVPGITNDKIFNDLKEQLDGLKEKLQPKTVSIQPKNNRWWMAAAAILLLGGVIFALYKLSDPGKIPPGTIAKQEDHSTNTITITPGVDSPAIVSQATTGTATVITPPSGNISLQKGNETPLTSATATKPVIPATNNPAAMQDVAIADDTNASAEKVTTAKKEYADIDKLKSKQPALEDAFNKNRSFSGKIVDDNNNAIPYANLVINNRQQTRTDSKGLFSLAMPDSVINLDVKAWNYASQNATVSPGNFQTITLTPKRKALKKSKTTTASSYKSHVQILQKRGVEPKEGWAKFQLYLIDELTGSTYDDGRPIKGEMILTFEVDINGEASKFDFEKPLDPEVNQAIEQLILSGTEWVSNNNKAAPGTVKLKIIF